MDHLCFCVLCFPCLSVCSLLPCGHLLGKGWPLGSCRWCLLYCVTFPCGFLGHGDTWLFRFLIFAVFHICLNMAWCKMWDYGWYLLTANSTWKCNRACGRSIISMFDVMTYLYCYTISALWLSVCLDQVFLYFVRPTVWSTVMSSMEENELALFEGRSESVSPVKAD